MQFSIASSLNMLTSKEEVVKSSKRIENERKPKPSFFSRPPTPTLLSFTLSIILVLHSLGCITGAYGYPLEARGRDITESNNNLLKWWASSSSGKVAGRQMQMDTPLGSGSLDERIKGLKANHVDDDDVDDDDLLDALGPATDDDNDNELPDFEALSRSNQNSNKKEKQRSGLITNEMSSSSSFPHQRSKKGLSYLSKFYSEALLHNNGGGGGGNVGNISSGGSGSKETAAQYFGERYGNGGIINASTSSSFPSSGEHSRFPSNVRRKLSFYPPLTLMSPWRSILSGSSVGSGSGSSNSGGRTNSLRLRWGK